MSEDKPLSENLKEWEDVLREEHEVAESGTSDDVAVNARSRLAQILPDAVTELNQIMRTGDKEDTVRLAAIKTVLEYTLGKPSPTTQKESDIQNIINSLTKEGAE